jgi:hypothetical protein
MVEIIDCGRTIASGLVAFDIRWAGPVPDQEPVQWSMFVGSEDGRDRVQLGLLRSEDGSSVQFVDDDTTGRRSEVDVDADLRNHDDPEGGEVTVRFPEEVVGVAVEWPVWRAVMVLGGVPVAERLVTP